MMQARSVTWSRTRTTFIPPRGYLRLGLLLYGLAGWLAGGCSFGYLGLAVGSGLGLLENLWLYLKDRQILDFTFEVITVTRSL